MERRTKVSLALAMISMVVGLACGPCNLLSKTLPTPAHEVIVSTEAAGQLESRLEQIAGSAPGQSFILSMTDAEVTSLLSAELAQYDESPIQNPVIWFTHGRAHGTGRLVNVVPVATDFYLVAQGTVLQGKIVVDILEMSAGALPLPQTVLETVSSVINETVEEMQLGVTVTSLEILDGEVRIRGSRD